MLKSSITILISLKLIVATASITEPLINILEKSQQNSVLAFIQREEESLLSENINMYNNGMATADSRNDIISFPEVTQNDLITSSISDQNTMTILFSVIAVIIGVVLIFYIIKRHPELLETTKAKATTIYQLVDFGSQIVAWGLIIYQVYTVLNTTFIPYSTGIGNAYDDLAVLINADYFEQVSENFLMSTRTALKMLW
jgi:hypothetical protein